MLAYGKQCTPRSMKTERRGVTRNGARGSGDSWWIYLVSLFGVLCLLQCTVVVDGAFTCPTNCTCDSYKVSGNKYQNITCTGVGLTAVPSDGKEGADVIKLILNNNQITSIELQYFTNLVELDLSNNQISSIPSNALANLTSLQNLNLAYNQISALDEDLFQETTNLQILNLGANTGITELPEHLLDNLGLITLDVSHMSLTEFPKSQLKHLENLRNVDASYNNITELPRHAIKHSVSYLNVQHNSLSTINKNAFQHPDNITELDLSYNQLETLDDETFEDLEHLGTLNLAHNSLTSTLDSDLFNDLTALQTLDLSYNEFSFLSTDVFSTLRTYTLDVSNNPFSCECDFRNFLYSVLYDSTLTLQNADTTECSDQGITHAYLDWDDGACTGNLGDNCTVSTECMVQNSACTNGTCVCQDYYYDTNTESTANGLCRPLVSLNYGCDIDDACETANAVCSGTSIKTCVCEPGYYDTSVYLGGTCQPQVGLGESCTTNDLSECNTTNAECGTNLKCVCESAYYDSNTDANDGGECILKIDLNNACSSTVQCRPANSECSGSQCTCLEGYYEIDNSGECQGPQSFYSCYPYSTSSKNVHFTTAATKSTTASCEDFCFNSHARYYLLISNVCICGIYVDSGTSCCPKVTDICASRQYIGPIVTYVNSGMSLTAVTPAYAGVAYTFSVTTTLAVIDQIQWYMGDSQTCVTVNGSSSSDHTHTYTRSGQYDVTIKACNQASTECDTKMIPHRVQEPRANMTTYITGRTTPFSTSSGVSNTDATFSAGYDFKYLWQVKDSNNVTRLRKGCQVNWTAHRNRCVKLQTTPASFSEATTACTNLGATLVQLKHMEEVSELVDALAVSSLQVLTDARKKSNVWVYNSDDSKTIFSNATLEEQTNGDCVVMNGPTKTLTTVDCSIAKPYACMKDPDDCPHGGEYLENMNCIILGSVLGASPMPRANAQDYCATNLNGWLVNITGGTVHAAISSYLTSSLISEAYIGLSDQFLENYLQWADNSTYSPYEYPLTPESGTTGSCFVAKPGDIVARADCDASKAFLCEYSHNVESLTIPTGVFGTKDLQVPGNISQQTPFSYFDDNSLPTEVVIMPGMWTSKSGKIRYYVIHTVDIPSGQSYDLGIYIIRLSCTSGSLCQPGCLDQQFASCATSCPACSQNNCGTDQHFCYLSNQCKFFNESCTCNSESGHTTACSATGTSPQYTVHAVTHVSINITGVNVVKIPAGDLNLQDLDVLAIQYEPGRNPIKSTNHFNDIDQQLTYKVDQTGWLTKNQPISISIKTDETMTYYIQGVYSDTEIKNLPLNLAYLDEAGDYEVSVTLIGTDQRELDIEMAEAIQYFDIIFPEINSEGTHYVEYDVEYDITTRVEMGSDVELTFDSNSAVSFQSECTSVVWNAVSSKDVCNASLVWSPTPYAFSRYTFLNTGITQKTYILSNHLGQISTNITFQVEKRIQDINLTLITAARLQDHVALNRETVFQVTYSEGTNVSYSYQVNGVGVAGSTSMFQYNFAATGTFVVSAFLTNILGVVSMNKTVYSYQAAEISGCILFPTPSVAVINDSIAVEVNCTVNLNAEISAEFIFDVDSTPITQGPITTTSTHLSLTCSKTFTSTGSVQVTVSLWDPFQTFVVDLSLNVYNRISSVSLAVSDTDAHLDQNVTITASTSSTPGNYGPVSFTADFGDSVTETNSHGIFQYAYTAAGAYQVNVTASNGGSSAFITQTITVYDVVDGLSVTDNGPTKEGTNTVVSAANSQGNLVSFQFVSFEFNVTQTSGVYGFTFSTAGIHQVNITCFNAVSSKSKSVTIYVLETTQIITESLKMNGLPIPAFIETNVSNFFGVSVIHYDPTNLAYTWNWGTGTPESSTSTMKSHTYTTAGTYTLNVTVTYATESTSQSITAELVVQDRIQNAALNVASEVGIPATGLLDLDVTVSTEGTSVTYSWHSNATTIGSSQLDTLHTEITSAGFYYFNVSLANGINSYSVYKEIEALEEISGVTINCATCVEDSGNLYVQSGDSVTFTAGTTTGTGISYTWVTGDGSTYTTSSFTHAYSAVGSYNMALSIYNNVGRLNQTVTVYIETALTSVAVTTYLYDWHNNVLFALVKDLENTDTARFSATAQPTGMTGITFRWQFDSGMSYVTKTSAIADFNYTATGAKAVTVTAINKVNNVTSSVLNIYVIEEITTMTVKEGDNTMSTNTNHLIAQNQTYNISVSSSQIVENTVQYTISVKNPNNQLFGSNSPGNPYAVVTPTAVGVYHVMVILENSLNQLVDTFEMEVIEPITGPYIHIDSGYTGNSTSGSSVNLYGGSDTGKYQTYIWTFASAPSGSVLSSTEQNVTLSLTSLGEYVVQLTVSNPVSSNLVVQYNIFVVEGISGAAIDIGSLSPTDAIAVGSTHTFVATVVTGTNMTYSWTIVGDVNPLNCNTKNCEITFGLQAYYNITLAVHNYASSETVVKRIYSLNPLSAVDIVTATTFNSLIGKYPVITGTTFQSSSDLTSTEFVDVQWQINSTTPVDTYTFDYTFNSLGTYKLQLTVSNKISSASSSVYVLVENAITGFQVTGGNTTYLINSDIQLGSTYTQGTDVSVQWIGSSTVSGSSAVFNYDSTGEHKINVTAYNYVSSMHILCIITALGTIDNVAATVSEYKFVGYAITFTTTGDYIDFHTTFVWTFSDGFSHTTTTPTIDRVMTVAGTYTVSVNVSNSVSSGQASSLFTVQVVQCQVPVLHVDSSNERTTLRSYDVVLAVTQQVNCEHYTSVYRWTLYVATSCQDTLSTKYDLPSNILTTTARLRLPGGTLLYNSYCAECEYRYFGTPVVKYAYFNLTINAAPLQALIDGGDHITVTAGSSITVSASNSNDPDNSAGVTLEYSWSCTQAMGTPTAIELCRKINNITAVTARVEGVLNELDRFNVTVIVSALNRISGIFTQMVSVTASNSPVVSVSCVSCKAYQRYLINPERKICLEGTCSSNCLASTTYLWTVTDMTTNADLTLTSQDSTTGTGAINFCLNAGTLQTDKSYKFTLQATSGSLVGSASQTFGPSSKPSSGLCSLNTTGVQVISLSTSIRATCQNWVDSDPNSGLYYKIMASTSSGDDSYIVHFGSQSVVDFYLAPWPGTSYGDVTVTVSVVNDHGVEVTAATVTVEFQAPTLLLGQTDMVNYLIDQLIGQMKMIAKKNNPNELVKYIIPAILFLNDQSHNTVNTTAMRRTIRDLFSYSLDSVLFSVSSSVHDIQQIASAWKFLSDYPDELSQDTLPRLDNAIESLSDLLGTSVQLGHDKNDYKTDSLQEAIANLISSVQSFTATSTDSTTINKLGPFSDYALAIGSSSTQSYTDVETMTKALAINGVEFRTELMLVQLKTIIVNEAVISETLTDGSYLVAEHVPRNGITTARTSNDVTVKVPSDIVDYTSYTGESVFVITVFDATNPYNFGYSSEIPVHGTLQIGYYEPTGSSITVSDLPSSKEVELYMFKDGSTSYTIATTLQAASGYNPREGVTPQCTNMVVGTPKTMSVTLPTDTDAGVHIQILAQFTASQSTGVVSAVLYKNSIPYQASSPVVSARPLTLDYEMYADLTWNHEDFTFFIPPSERDVSAAVDVRFTTNMDVTVCVAKYYSKCSFFEKQTSTWSYSGCTPQSESIPVVAKCQCNHMTSYGSGLLLSPDQIDFTDLTEIDVVNNPVAIITCSVILGLYIILVFICRKMDTLDIKHISSIPLCGKDGSFKYEVMVFTGRQLGSGTTAHVGIQLLGSYWKTAQKHIYKEGAFQRNCCDTFIIAHDVNIGDVKKIRIWHDNTGSSPPWYLDHVVIKDLQNDQLYYFYIQSWLTLETTSGTIHRKVPAAGAQDRNRFGHRFKMAIFSSLADKHLWLSLLNRPAQSRFTRVQRATCCVTLLFTFICVNAMWYGLLKKDNQDLGWESFSLEEIILAIVTNFMVLPINLGLILLFKKSRSKANLFERLQKPETAQTIEIENYCGNSQGGSFESHNTGEVPFDLDRESTIDSVQPNTLLYNRGLHRSRHVSKRQRENTDDSLGKTLAVSVTHSSGVPSAQDDLESLPSTSSGAVPKKAGLGSYKKGKTIGKAESDELLAELDKMMESEPRPTRSASSRHSETSTRSRRLTMSELEGIDDILHSDDEASGTTKTPKKGVLKSTKRGRFNPRADPRINGSHLPSRGSIMSSMSTAEPFSQDRPASSIAAGLRPAYYSELTMESRDIRHIPIHKEKCSLPPWCVYIAYVLCFLLSAFSVVIVILYCFKFGADEALKWLLACLLSLFLSLCVVEPLKALMIAIYMVAMMKNVDTNDEDDCIEIDPTIDLSQESIQEQVFEPISGFALIRASDEGRKIRRMKTIIRQFFAYMFYLWVVMVIVYVHFHYNSYLFNKHVETSFINSTTTNHVGYNNISTIEEFWDWSENVFAETLHLQDSQTDEEHGFLLGAARMRLIRSMTEKCQASSAAASLGASILTNRVCYGDGGFDEDTGFYGERWNESSFNKSWKYEWANELGGSDKLGYVATYGGGGYTQTLGTSYAETLTIIQDLKDKGWIDLRTRAVVLEFSFYSPGSDMTAVTSMLVEFPLTGGAITSYEIISQKLLWFYSNRVDSLMVMECILLVVVIYSCVHIVLQIREKRLAFFKEFWHWYEILTTTATIVSIGMYIGCVVEATNTFNNFLDDQTGFTNFEHTAYVHVGMRYLYAWLLFLLMYKVVKQLRFIKFLYVYGATLSTAFGHLIGAFLIYTILLLSYAQLGYLMFGRNIRGFETVGNAVTTLVVLIRGTYNFWPMLYHHPVFSHFYVYSYYAFAYGILVALVISILQSCYRINKSKMYYKDTVDMKDYEMIEFMMKRFKLWAGIKKPKPAFRRVHFPDLIAPQSRASTSHSNRSTESTDSASRPATFDHDTYEPYLQRMVGRLGPTWQKFLRRLEELEILDQEEQRIVTEAEAVTKDLNLRCRINELERQEKAILSWQKPSSSKPPPASDSRLRQSQRATNHDNQGRKAPSTVTGATSTRAAATPPGKEPKASTSSKRPLSDQGARSEQLVERRASAPDSNSKIQKFIKTVKPSKPAWSKDT